MKSHEAKPLKSPQLYSYIIGFVLSIICTLVVYALVSRHVASDHNEISHRFLVAITMAFAMVQLIVQLVFFLHLGREQKPKWNTYALLFTGLIVTIVVAGTLWIMANLDYSHASTSPSQAETEIIKDEGFGAGHSDNNK